VRVLSLTVLIQEAIASPTTKKISGNIKSFPKLFEPESLRALEDAHQGIFSFLAFHPAADLSVTDYVRAGTLSSDSGKDVLALFTLDAAARWPIEVTDKSFANWLEVDTSVHPAYEMIRMLFDPEVPPPVPGIIFFDTFAEETEVVYVSMSELVSEQEVRKVLRRWFALAANAWQDSFRKPRGTFADRMSAALLAERAQYVRTGKTSMREWLIRSFHFLQDQKSDLVTIIAAVI
jgi:hypothetical protein